MILDETANCYWIKLAEIFKGFGIELEGLIGEA